MKTQALTLMLALLAAFSLPAAAQLVPSTRIITQAELDAEKQKAAQTAAEADKLRQQLREAQSAPKPEPKLVEKVVTKEVPDPKAQEALRKAQEDRAAAEQRERQAKAEADARASEIAALKKQLAAKSTAKAAPLPVAPSVPVVVPASQPTNAPGQPGTSFKACTDCPEMIWLPRGSFMFGSPENEVGRYTDEIKQREIIIKTQLAAGKYPVTFSEWDACSTCPFIDDNGWGRGEQPAINVSYEDIVNFYLPWLNKKAAQNKSLPENFIFSLPTEIEREYLARGIENSKLRHPPFPSLKNTKNSTEYCPNTDTANYNGFFDYSKCGANTGVFLGRPLPVKTFINHPNSFGLIGVTGNIYEWTSDCNMPNERNVVPEAEIKCPRSVRGGSWKNSPDHLRAAFRNASEQNSKLDNLGFRVIFKKTN